MQAMGAGSVDLVFADPPFNIGYEYDKYSDNQTDAHYLLWSRQWIVEAKRLLKPAGTFWLAIGDKHAADLDVVCRSLGFHRRSWVIWYYTFGVNCKRKFTPSHTHLLHYVADKKHFTFNADAIKVPSARQAKYGDKRAAAGGRLPDDTWQFSRVCGTFKERCPGHPCQMPESALDRIIRVSSNCGDLVLDPFAGSGTTPAVAEKLGRRHISFELSDKYGQVIADRMAAIGKEKTECPAASQSPQTACS
jgi:DNA modification methylase